MMNNYQNFNPYIGGYAYANPYNPVQQKQTIAKVNGKNGADMYQLPPNSEALLLDETAPIVWLIQTDSAGYKTATAFDLVAHKEATPATLQDLMERVEALEREVKSNNGKSNSRKVEPKQAANSTE
nr:MAG TPA: hypothetical protein [Caudoviricetes sp.]